MNVTSFVPGPHMNFIAQVNLFDWGHDAERPPERPLLPSAGQEAQGLDRLYRFLQGRDGASPPRVVSEAREALAWLEEVYVLVHRNEPDDAIDLLFDHVDRLLQSGEFRACDDLLKTIDAGRLDTNLMIAVLTITRSSAAQLPGRSRFVRRVEGRLRELAPTRVERLLSDLR